MYGTISNQVQILRRDLDRLFDELERISRPHTGRRADERAAQRVPVNVFETENELMVVAPMPGMEAGDLEIEVADSSLTLRADKRGPGQEHHRYLIREWSYGPYERTLELPFPVDVERANASYGNGILTIALPKTPGRRARRIEIGLETTGAGRGERVGHRGVAEAGSGRRTGPKGQ